jgi:hypothetical protein
MQQEMESSGDLALMNPTTGSAGCCARAANGHAAAPPSSVMNARRLMPPIRPSSSPGMATSDRPARGRSTAASGYPRLGGKSWDGPELF